MQKLNSRVLTLFLLSIVCLTLGLIWKDFPGFIFIALSPIIALREYHSGINLKHKILYILVVPLILVSAFLLSSIILGSSVNYIPLIVYVIAMVLPFLLLEVSEHYASNKWGVLMLVVYWLGVEYLLLKLFPETAVHFLSNVLPPLWMGWNSYTGFLGGSIFIIFGNVLFYHALYKDGGVISGRIRWISTIASAVLIVLIAWLGTSFNLDTQITLENMLEAYHSHSMVVGDTSYAENGELMGRLGLWVTVMVLLYSGVKSKMAKK